MLDPTLRQAGEQIRETRHRPGLALGKCVVIAGKQVHHRLRTVEVLERRGARHGNHSHTVDCEARRHPSAQITRSTGQ